jgi:hypothetical protein
MDPNLPVPEHSNDNFSSHSIDPNNDFSWLLEVLVIYLKSPVWTSEICDFIDDNCILFAGDLSEENSLEMTELHKRFEKIVDLKLEEFCNEYNVTHKMFMTACSQI